MIHNILIDPWADSIRSKTDTLSINIGEEEIWTGLRSEGLQIVHDIELTSGVKNLNIVKSGQEIISQPITIDNYWDFYQISIIHKRSDIKPVLKRYTIDSVLFEETGLE